MQWPGQELDGGRKRWDASCHDFLLARVLIDRRIEREVASSPAIDNRL